MADRCVHILAFFGGFGLTETCCVMELLEDIYLRVVKLRRSAEPYGEGKPLRYSARKVYNLRKNGELMIQKCDEHLLHY